MTRSWKEVEVLTCWANVFWWMCVRLSQKNKKQISFKADPSMFLDLALHMKSLHSTLEKWFA